MEKDYDNIDHYNYVKQKLEEYDFIEINSIDYGKYAIWCKFCSYFFQVWKKQNI